MTAEYTAEMAHAAAERGAAWLDKRCPDWRKQIKLRRLNMKFGDGCILGQTATCLLGHAPLAPEYGYTLVVAKFAPRSPGAWSVRYGFNLPARLHGYLAEWEMLDIAWRELIRTRLEAVR